MWAGGSATTPLRAASNSLVTVSRDPQARRDSGHAPYGITPCRRSKGPGYARPDSWRRRATVYDETTLTRAIRSELHADADVAAYGIGTTVNDCGVGVAAGGPSRRAAGIEPLSILRYD